MGRSTRLGYEKEAVCIVSREGVYVGRSTRLGYEKEAVCVVSWEGGYVGTSARLRYENEAICIVSGGYKDGRFVTCSCAMISVFVAFRRRSRGYPGEAWLCRQP